MPEFRNIESRNSGKPGPPADVSIAMTGHGRSEDSEDEVVRAQVRDSLNADAPAGEGQNRVVTLGPQRHRGLVVPVPVVAMPVAPCQLGEAGVERDEVDAVLATREVFDHVTAAPGPSPSSSTPK